LRAARAAGQRLFGGRLHQPRLGRGARPHLLLGGPRPLHLDRRHAHHPRLHHRRARIRALGGKMNASTHMRREIEEIPSAVATLLDRQHDASAALGAALRERDPSVLVTIARGSSDHAATFFKYAAERLARRPVASVGPSIASIYGIDLMLAGAAAIA